MQIVDVLRHNLTLRIVPGAVSDAVARADCARTLSAKIGSPGLARRSGRLRQHRAMRIRARDPAEIGAFARAFAGDKEAHLHGCRAKGNIRTRAHRRGQHCDCHYSFHCAPSSGQSPANTLAGDAPTAECRASGFRRKLHTLHEDVITKASIDGEAVEQPGTTRANQVLLTASA